MSEQHPSQAAPTQCPTGLTFTKAGAGPKSIKDFFAPYVSCMISQGINLGLYNGTNGDSVIENIDAINTAINNGSMPRGQQKGWNAEYGTFYWNCWYNTPGHPE